MADDLTTRDVLQQIDTRLKNVEQDLRGHQGEFTHFRSEVGTEFKNFRSEVAAEFKSFRAEVAAEFKNSRAEVRGEFTAIRSEISALTRWGLGLMFASWMTVIASIWLKP